MPRIDQHPPGSFCWFELATTDQAAAKQFYTRLFGWEVADFPIGPSEQYSIFRRGGRDTAAAYTMREEQREADVPPFWMVYVATKSADETAARVKKLGGQVMAEPFDVMDNGRMAVVTDPAGAHFALWQPKTHQGTGVTGEPGTVTWVEISVPDRAKVMKFYQDLFGWKMVTGKDPKPAGPGDEYPHIMLGDAMLGGLPPPEQRDPDAPPHFLIYISVDDVAASTERATALGATVFVESMDIGDSGIISVMADPQGAVFALHQAAART
jgi:predicted enzyme related to lactoylglutathione lyase